MPNVPLKTRRAGGCNVSTVVRTGLCLAVLVAASHRASAQDASTVAVTPDNQLAVNWIYGAYIPKEAPIESLNADMRMKLFVRQSFTTPGIYIKTGFFALHDQIENTPPDWGDDFSGFAKRVGTRQTEFILLNSIIALGDGALGWEPRYDRCKCDGVGRRMRHAIVRNFVTYDRTEKHLRPQLMPYIASFGSSVTVQTWQPNNPNYLVKGYQGAITQIWVGSLTNLMGEFLPDIMRKIKKH